MLDFPFSLIVFVFGTIAGSFLNCVIYRLALPSFSLKNLGGLRGRSFCPLCKHTLSWQDLIPVLSFLFLRGKCRYCQKKISWQYPLVEISTGLVFLLIYNLQFSLLRQGFGGQAIFNFIYYLIISSFLIIIFVYDFKHYIIPDKIIYPAIVIAFLYQLFRILNFGFVSDFGFRISDFKALASSPLSAILASTFFLAIVLVSRGRWMGAGDIKLAFFMGLFLGWPNILVALFSAFFIGAIIGTGLIVAGRKKLSSEIPFGPFLVTGTFLAMFFGRELIDCYLNFFLIK